MNKPSFYEGVGVAIAASLTGSAIFTVLSPLFHTQVLIKILVTVLGLAYCLYILRRSDERIGRVTVVLTWCALSLILWLAMPPLSLFVIVHTGMIWLLRSLYFYQSLIAALIDLALSALSLVIAIWAGTHSNSLFLGVWCFFLIHALFTFIPPNFSKRKSKMVPGNAHTDRFEHAYRDADAVLRKLSNSAL